jgi:isoleucyl-tRNA synthetase
MVADKRPMEEAVRQVLMPMWNAWYFLSLYANAAGRRGSVRAAGTVADNVLDRYVLAKTRALVADMTDALDVYDLFGACQLVREHLDVLTNWYVRRSRDRFWAGEHDAIDTMHTVLSVLARVVAPLLPLVSEEIYCGLHGADDEGGPRSVHLTDWPSVDELPADDDLVDTMDLVRDVCSATLSVRKAHQRRVRLPLQAVTVASADADRLADFVDVIADEVNVRRVDLTTDVASVATERLQLVPAKLGPRLGKDVQRVIKAHKSGDWTVDGDVVIVGGVTLEPGEYSLELVASGDQASAGLGTHTGVIALDIEVTEELEVEGRARDLVRLVQQARRDAGLDVSDRIELSVVAGDEWIDAIDAHRGLIAGETLATSVRTERTSGDSAGEPAITVNVSA